MQYHHQDPNAYLQSLECWENTCSSIHHLHGMFSSHRECVCKPAFAQTHVQHKLLKQILNCNLFLSMPPISYDSNKQRQCRVHRQCYCLYNSWDNIYLCLWRFQQKARKGYQWVQSISLVKERSPKSAAAPQRHGRKRYGAILFQQVQKKDWHLDGECLKSQICSPDLNITWRAHDLKYEMMVHNYVRV